MNSDYCLLNSHETLGIRFSCWRSKRQLPSVERYLFCSKRHFSCTACRTIRYHLGSLSEANVFKIRNELRDLESANSRIYI